MKPTPQFKQIINRRDSAGVRPGIAFPKTDFGFKANSLDDFPGRCGGKRFPSFRGISNDYFRKEARNHFASEATVFALIVITAAVPVFQAVRGLIQFVYGVL